MQVMKKICFPEKLSRLCTGIKKMYENKVSQQQILAKFKVSIFHEKGLLCSVSRKEIKTTVLKLLIFSTL